MAAPGVARVKRKVVENDDISSSSQSDFDSDDSIKDKDYLESSGDSDSSEDSLVSVSLKVMWLITF